MLMVLVQVIALLSPAAAVAAVPSADEVRLLASLRKAHPGSDIALTTGPRAPASRW